MPIHTYQRRALESLKPEEPIPLIVSLEDEYWLQGERIFLIGASPGIGTCSELHGIYIAVFEKNQPTRVQLPKGKKRVRCDWSSLQRVPTKEEKKEWQRQYKTPCCLVVQRIEVTKVEKKNGFNSVHFVLTKKKKLWCSTIT